ncbi:MAG: ATP-binding cassette domain-containing protein [Pseudomonadota bacterium]
MEQIEAPQTPNPTARLTPLVLPLLILGLFANLTMLVSPIFMMQMLDRVVPSGNMATLGLLLMIAVVVIALGSFIDAKRLRIVKDLGLWVEAKQLNALERCPPHIALQRTGDVTALRSPVIAQSIISAFDAPWVLIFLTALYLLNPLFVILIGVSLVLGPIWSALNKSSADQPLNEPKLNIADAVYASGPVLPVMNIGRNFFGRLNAFSSEQRDHLRDVIVASERSQRWSLLVRQITQLGLLALGGALVSADLLSAGGMIAASLIGAKTLGLAEGSIQNWPNMRNALTFLVLPKGDSDVDAFESPADGSVQVAQLMVPHSAGGGFRLNSISFELESGACLALLGASGSGKSSLLSFVSGAEPVPFGQVSIGGVDLKRMSAGDRQSMFGVVPQLNHFRHGTISDVIACFDPAPDQDQVERVAAKCGVHNTILGLPKGYATDLAEDFHLLSVGQMQRLALARAMYYDPKVLLLDEPSSLQDSLGERQILDALARLKADGVTIIMIVHRTSAMWLADHVLVLDKGKVIDRGTRSEVLARRANPNQSIDLALTDAGVQDVEDWISHQFQREGDTMMRQRAIIVATELYNFVRQSGSETAQRSVRMMFRHLSAERMSIAIQEEGNAALVSALPKAQERLNAGSWVADQLDETDMALMLLSQSADDLKLDVRDKTAAVHAHLQATPSQGTGRRN